MKRIIPTLPNHTRPTQPTIQGRHLLGVLLLLLPESPSQGAVIFVGGEGDGGGGGGGGVLGVHEVVLKFHEVVLINGFAINVIVLRGSPSC